MNSVRARVVPPIADIAILAAVIVLGCTDGNNGPDAGGEPGDSGALKVVVTRSTFFHTENGVLERKADLSDAGVAVLVETGTGYAVYPGLVLDAGVVVVAGLPIGPRLVRLGDSYVASMEELVDFSQHELGRADLAVATVGTRLAVNSSGMSPWIVGSELQLISANAALIGTSAQNSLQVPLAAGETRAQLLFDYITLSRATLINATKGDQASLAQLVPASLTQADGGRQVYTSLLNFAPFSDLTIADGTLATAPVTFSPVAQVTYALNWKRATFESHRAEVNPSAVTLGQVIAIDPIPFTTAEGFYASSTPDVVFFPASDADNPATSGNDINGTLNYGNPYPWPLFGSVSHAYGVTHAIADAGSRVSVARIAYQALLPEFSGPLQPIITPPLAPEIDGQTAFMPRTLASATPTIQWAVPALGTPDWYRIVVFKFGKPASGTRLTRSSVATFVTKATSLTLPSGVLVSGGTYAIQLSAEIRAGVNGAATPLRGAFPNGSAELLTALLLVP